MVGEAFLQKERRQGIRKHPQTGNALWMNYEVLIIGETGLLAGAGLKPAPALDDILD